ncbi:MAG: diguanylate cyclase [Christensenella sp.]|uniref:sensor domain-containing diguanylate cyclase n=1 Tax=Christensenella sp. TaxID=1935934 RepID=UPI002B20DD98|nr:diguanylate cyclase [Christensenella sp.]MEA5003274.1 diguanylate cyclase [Christensenella sp.]
MFSKPFSKRISVVLSVFIFVCLVITLIYNGIAPAPPSASDSVYPLSDGWSVTAGGQTKNDQITTLSYLGTPGEEVTFANTIPDEGNANGDALCIQIYTSPFSVYFNDEKIYEYGFAASNDGYLSVGSGYHIIDLPGGPGDVRIVVQLAKGTPAVSLSDASLMPGSVFFQQFVQGRLFTLIAVLILVSVFVYVLIARNMRTTQHTKSAPALAALSLLAAIWILARSGLLQFFTNDLLLINGVDFITFFLLPLAVIRFVQTRLHITDNRPLNVCLLAGIVFFITACILHTARLVDFTQTLLVFHILLIIDFVCIITSIFKNQEGDSLSLKVLRIGVLILVVSAILEMVLYFLLSFGFLKFSALEIGLLGFTLCMLYVWTVETRDTRKQLERQSVFRKMAYTDSLTNLDNRTAFDGMIERLNKDKNSSIHIFMIDLNHLKRVNDSLGHSEGDRYLCASANILQKEFDENGEIFRIGGDEFVVILKSSHENAARILKRLRAYRSSIKDTPYYTFAVGCAAFDAKRDRRLQDTLRRADKLMYAYKKKLQHNENMSL